MRSGLQTWNERVHESRSRPSWNSPTVIRSISAAATRGKIAFVLPLQARIVSNAAGVTGGVRLWEPEIDEFFDR